MMVGTVEDTIAVWHNWSNIVGGYNFFLHSCWGINVSSRLLPHWWHMVSGCSRACGPSSSPSGFAWFEGFVFPLPKESLWLKFCYLFDATALSNRIHLLSVFIVTLMPEVTPAGRDTHRMILAFGSYCAADRTAWNLTCLFFLLQDHRGSPVWIAATCPRLDSSATVLRVC